MRPALIVLLAVSVAMVVGIGVWGAYCTEDEGNHDRGARIPIERLDLAGVELTYADFFNPPFAAQYPSVVATVNGEEVTGEALVRRQLQLELNLRGAKDTDDYLGVVGDYTRELLVLDPLEAVIDDTLERQAIERLGLLPSQEEAIEYTRAAEESFYDAADQANPDGSGEGREESLDLMRLQGLPTRDWASSEKLVEVYRQGAGKARLRQQVCRNTTEIQGFLNLSTGRDCSAFLADEREDADIVYYVRWAVE